MSFWKTGGTLRFGCNLSPAKLPFKFNCQCKDIGKWDLEEMIRLLRQTNVFLLRLSQFSQEWICSCGNGLVLKRAEVVIRRVCPSWFALWHTRFPFHFSAMLRWQCEARTRGQADPTIMLLRLPGLQNREPNKPLFSTNYPVSGILLEQHKME